MMINELSKRVDQELAQLHTRLDDLASNQNRRAARQVEEFITIRDEQRVAIHEMHNTLTGFKLRIESLEQHPPAFPIGNKPV